MPLNRLRTLSLVALAALATAALLSGCGYRFAGSGSDAPFVLKEGQRKLWIKSVENPTSDTWLGPTLRSLLRDEITNRAQAEWVDKNEAEAWVEVLVENFTTQTTVTGEKDESLKYSASISMVVIVRSALDGSTLWSSGRVNASESFYGTEPEMAKLSAVELAVERAVDRMSQNY